MVDRLLRDGHSVVGYDNLSTGRLQFLERARDSQAFRFVEGDLLDTDRLAQTMRGATKVVHLAANADVRFGLDHPRRDLEQNTIATFNVLEAMRANHVKEIAFSSTGSVYGEAKVVPTPENAPFPIQTSLYGASKLACEGLVSAYAEGYGMKAVIFRFVSILGERYSHGHVFDFMAQLAKDPSRLRVLGDGRQQKSYLYVGDCIEAMLTCLAQAADPISIFNLGVEDSCQVVDSIGWISNRLGAHPRLEFSGGKRGWVGDNPLIQLDTAQVRALGWSPRLTIREGVERTVDWLNANRWIFEARAS